MEKLRQLLTEFVKKNSFLFGQEPQTKLTPLSRLSDLVAYVNGPDDFRKEYEFRKKNSPNWFVTLGLWISEIESNIYKTDFLGVQQFNGFVGDSYQITLKGLDPSLYEFFIESEKDLFDLVTGFIYAHNLSTLQDEHTKLVNEKLSNEINFQGDNKIEWVAGPAYLGHLIDELESKGYLKLKGKSLTDKANEVLSVFNLKTTIGTFEKELSERQNSLTPDSKSRFVIKPYKSN